MVTEYMPCRVARTRSKLQRLRDMPYADQTISHEHQNEHMKRRLIPLREVARFHPVHGRPPPDLPLFPMVVCWILRVFLQAIPTRILEPGDPASVRVTLEHEGAIIMTDKHVGQAVAADINGDHGHGSVELRNPVLGPCYDMLVPLTKHQSSGRSTHYPRGHLEGLCQCDGLLRWGCQGSPRSRN